MTDRVDIGLFIILGKRGNIRAQVIDGVSHHVGQAGSERGHDNIGIGSLLLRQGRIRTTVGVNGINLGQMLLNDITQGRNLGIAVADRLERINLIADLQPLLTIEPIQPPGFLAVEVAQQRVVGSHFVGVGDRLKQLVVGRHGIGVAVVALLGSRRGITGDNSRPVVASVRHRQRHFNVPKGRGKQLGQFKVDRGPLDVAEDIASGFVGSHAARVGIVSPAAH